MTKLTILVASLLLSTTLAFQVVVNPAHARVITTSTMMAKTPFFADFEDVEVVAEEVTTVVTAAVAAVEVEPTTTTAATKLEQKMASWEATEEEIKASTLGGIGMPSKKQTDDGEVGLNGKKPDGFDLGLYVAFPFMILGSLLFAFFPLIMDKIDVTSVGPPPMI